MPLIARYGLLLLGLAAGVFSVWAARESGVFAYYIGAGAFALIGVGAFGFPALDELSAARPAHLQTWWAPAVLFLGLLVLVGVLAVRFVLVPAA